MGNVSFEQSILIYIFSIWSLIWKGLALWRASKNGQRNWFICLLVLNTIGILDIIFLFRFSKKRMTFAEIKNWFRITFFTKKESK
jgi:methionyl-tRNA synthetase